MRQDEKPTAAPKATKDGRPLNPRESERAASEFAEEITAHNVQHTAQNSLDHQAEPHNYKN
ncbi:hypothetical protein DUZ99_15090 [Xylanibacillus composti]|uniref:Uncharacterized protein n=1 Tax=Xylanibacillus composti TaxID=1572762 RepID=A0A8J4H4E9_9BACL|nr:hypothetical protein [Xylanibacillus composti]MDT9726306.1 hypothetical protein [Xylanibacillus composti]GIQ70664.1 hypothetical protein XYCOK13_34880 [Xylanibacillus composti]